MEHQYNLVIRDEEGNELPSAWPQSFRWPRELRENEVVAFRLKCVEVSGVTAAFVKVEPFPAVRDLVG